MYLQHPAADKSSGLSILTGYGIGRIDYPHVSNIALSQGQGLEAFSVFIRSVL